MKNKGFKIAFGIYVLMFFVDLISTMINGELVQYLEANPLYDFGGLYIIIVANFLFMLLFWYGYNKTRKVGVRFVLMWGLIMIITFRVVVAYQNFLIYLTPPTLEEAIIISETFSTMEKASYMVNLSMLINLVPLAQTYFTYLFFEKDHNITLKNGN